MITKHYGASKLLNYHLTYRKTEPDTILVDIVFDIKSVKHFPDHVRFSKANSLISYSYF